MPPSRRRDLQDAGRSEEPQTLHDAVAAEKDKRSAIREAWRTLRLGQTSEYIMTNDPSRAKVFTLWLTPGHAKEEIEGLCDPELRTVVGVVDFQLELGGSLNEFRPHLQGQFTGYDKSVNRPLSVVEDVGIPHLFVQPRFGTITEVHHYCHAPHEIGCRCLECGKLGARDSACPCQDCSDERDKIKQVVEIYGSVENRLQQYFDGTGENWEEIKALVGGGAYRPVVTGPLKLSTPRISQSGMFRRIRNAAILEGCSYREVRQRLHDFDPDFRVRDPQRYGEMLKETWEVCEARSEQFLKRGQPICVTVMLNAPGLGKSERLKQKLRRLGVDPRNVLTLGGKQDNYDYNGETDLFIDEFDGSYFKQQDLKLVLNNEGFRVKILYMGYRQLYFKRLFITSQYESILHWYTYSGDRGLREAIALVRRMTRHPESEIWYMRLGANGQAESIPVIDVYRRFAEANTSAGAAVFNEIAEFDLLHDHVMKTGDMKVVAVDETTKKPKLVERGLDDLCTLAHRWFGPSEDEDCKGITTIIPSAKIRGYVWGDADGPHSVRDIEPKVSLPSNEVMCKFSGWTSDSHAYEALLLPFEPYEGIQWEIVQGAQVLLERQMRLAGKRLNASGVVEVLGSYDVRVANDGSRQWRIGPLTLEQQGECTKTGLSIQYARCQADQPAAQQLVVRRQWREDENGNIVLSNVKVDSTGRVVTVILG